MIMDDLILSIQKSYGLVGLFMISPIAAVVFLWRQLLKTQDKLEAAKDDRTNDAKAISEKLIALVGEQSALNKETTVALERVGDMLSLSTKR